MSLKNILGDLLLIVYYIPIFLFNLWCVFAIILVVFINIFEKIPNIIFGV